MKNSRNYHTSKIILLIFWLLFFEFSANVNSSGKASEALMLISFTVNSANDGADANIGNGICETATVGECTLRAAIQEANFTIAADTINFNIGAGGLQTINVGAGGLPQISQPLTIDGTTQPGFTLAPIIELNGTSAGAGIDGLRITAANTTIKSLVINRFASDGIEINGEAADGNTISGCYIGTSASGTVDLGNTSAGIFITGGADNTTVGGATTTAGTAPGNVISGNNNRGIYITLATTTNTAIQGNIIGLQANGTAGMGNGALGEGILIENSTGNRIGGTTATARNIISGNLSDGVDLFNTSANLIESNYIGTNITGTAALGNMSHGIIIRSSINNTVGGSTATPGTSPGNLISGNGDGVRITTAGSGNIVQGNIIGLNANGTAQLGNTSEGVLVESQTSGSVGGATTDLRNIISANDSHGVLLTTSSNILVAGNYIGTDISGVSDFGNDNNGVLVSGGSNNAISANVVSGNGNNASTNPDGVEITTSATNIQIRGNIIGLDASGTNALGNNGNGVLITTNGNTVGGTTTGEANKIAFNALDGVFVSAGTGNRILSNSIFSNGNLGIDLGTNGITPNDLDDPDTGANNLQNFPVISTATTGSTRVIGTFNSLPNTTFRLEFFNSPTADGEGQTFIGAFDITTDTGGDAAFDQTFAPNSPINSFVTATATNLATGDTSEFSAAKEVLIPLASTATIRGQVLDASGRGIAKARLNLIHSDGTIQTALTNAFGYYSFPEIPTGQTVVISISAKGFEFSPDSLILTVSEDIETIIWTANAEK